MTLERPGPRTDRRRPSSSCARRWPGWPVRCWTCTGARISGFSRASSGGSGICSSGCSGRATPGSSWVRLLVVAALAFLVFAAGRLSGQGRDPARAARAAGCRGSVQRLYPRGSRSRAGDLVKRDDVLAVLEDRELKLERLKWAGQQEELNKQLRQAMAERNPSQTQILSAQLDQVRAQLRSGRGPAGAHAHHRTLRRGGGVRRPDSIAGRTGGARYGAVRESRR